MLLGSAEYGSESCTCFHVSLQRDHTDSTCMTGALDAGQNVLSRLQELALQRPLVASLHLPVGAAGTFQRYPLQPQKTWHPFLILLQ